MAVLKLGVCDLRITRWPHLCQKPTVWLAQPRDWGMEVTNSTPISAEIMQEAGKYASVYSCSVPMQIEHWARIGKIAEENPDLPYQFIEDVLSRNEHGRPQTPKQTTIVLSGASMQGAFAKQMVIGVCGLQTVPASMPPRQPMHGVCDFQLMPLSRAEGVANK